MSYFRCGGCGQKHDIFQRTRGKKADDKNTLYASSPPTPANDDNTSGDPHVLPLLCRVPIEQDVCSASDEGTPISLLDPDSDAGKAYVDGSRKLWDIMNGKAQTSETKETQQQLQGTSVQ